MALITLIKKDLQSSFRSASAYVFLCSFLVLTNWVFFRTFFITNQATLKNYFQFTPWALLFFVAAISMGKWSDEKRLGTHEILLTLPLSETSLVLSKFLSSAFFIFLALALTLPLAFTCASLGKMDWGQTFSLYFGLYLLSLCFLSLGLLCSLVSKNPMVSFILCSLGSFFLYVLGEPLLLGSAPQWMLPFLSYINFQTHYENFARGIVPLKSLTYLLSFIFGSLFLHRTLLKKI